MKRTTCPRGRFAPRFQFLVAVVCGVLGIAAGGFDSAIAQTAAKTTSCPSKDYYVARASNTLTDVPSQLNYVLCVLITTANRQIDVKTQVVVEAGNAKLLRDRLITALTNSGECGYSNLGGWEITELNLQFRRAGASSRIRVAGQGRQCLTGGRWLTFSYEVPLDHALSNGVLSFSIREQEAASTLRGFEFEQVTTRISAALREMLGGMTVDLNSYVPSYVRAFGPSVERADLLLAGDRVMLKLSGTGRLTGAAGDRLLSDTTKDLSAEQVLQLLRRKGPMS